MERRNSVSNFFLMNSATGTITRLTKLTESSLIVHWLTEEAGLIKTVAKGARRPKSTYAGQLDLFHRAEFLWSPARSGELHRLGEVTVHGHREGLRGSYGQTLMATYFCQLIERVTEPGVPVPEFYFLLEKALDYLSESAHLRVMQRFEKRVALLLGVLGEGGDAASALLSHCGDLPGSRRQVLAHFSKET